MGTDGHNSLILPVNHVYGICLLAVEGHVLKLFMNRMLRAISVYHVKQSHYRPEVSRGFQEVKVPRLRDNGPGWW